MRLTPLAGAALCVVLSTTACAGGGSSRASTLIIPPRRIGPIYLAESKAKIEGAYGSGHRVKLNQGTADPVVTYYPTLAIGVMYYANHAVYIETSSSRYRTKSGLGVGTRVAQLRKTGANCTQDPSFCGVAQGNLATTYFLKPSVVFPDRSGLPQRVVRIWIGPLGS